MSDEQHIGNDKSRYINAPKRTEVIHRSAGISVGPSSRNLNSYALYPIVCIVCGVNGSNGGGGRYELVIDPRFSNYLLRGQ